MGIRFNKPFNLSVKPTHKIVFIGESGSGKTTALYKLKLNQNIDTGPTPNYNIEILPFRNSNL